MALPDDFNLAAFLDSVDRNTELRGMRVVYFDGFRMMVLREGPPICQVGLMTIVLRDKIEDAVLHSPSASQSRDGKLLFELLGLGLSCSAAVLGWVVVAGGAGAAPITGGSSVFLTYLAIGAAGASSIQCVNAIGRAGAEIYAPHELDILDSEGWYQKAMLFLDGMSLAGAVGSAAVTIRMALRTEGGDEHDDDSGSEGPFPPAAAGAGGGGDQDRKPRNQRWAGKNARACVRVSKAVRDLADQPGDQEPAP
jgi:hypothetical protein